MARKTIWARSVIVLLLVLTIVPFANSTPLQAARFTQQIDDTVAQFGDGEFQRTSLTPSVASDEGVQLIPVGIIDNWSRLDQLLPNPVAGHGLVSIGRFLFVIGGESAITGGTVNSEKVYVNEVNLANGELIREWDAIVQPDLPAPPDDGLDFTPEAAGRADLAAVAVVTNEAQGDGYIYVMGGAMTDSQLSSQHVLLGRVDNGVITGWTNLGAGAGGDAGLPSARHRGQAVVFTAQDGNTYVYYIGGLARRRSFGGAISESAQANVFYARVDLSSGNLCVPTTGGCTPGWAESDMAGVLTQDNPNASGIFDGTAVAARVIDSAVNPPVRRDQLYLFGGQVRSAAQAGGITAYTSKVFRATIGANGALTWDDPVQGNNDATLTNIYTGHRTAIYAGNLYVTGGRQGGASSTSGSRTIQTSYLADDGTIAVLGDSGQTFLPSDNVFPQPRYQHQITVVGTSTSRAYLFTAGGRASSTAFDTNDIELKTVYYGVIGDRDSVQSYGYAASGWYYSNIVPLGVVDTKIKELIWNADNPNPGETDIQFYYRYGSSIQDLEAQGWTLVDGDPNTDAYSRAGENRVELNNLPARFFQYRVYLQPNAARDSTPTLLSAGLTIIVPGGPNLRAEKVEIVTAAGSASVDRILVTLSNSKTANDPLPIYHAAADGGGEFYVDIYVSPASSAQPPVLGEQGDAYLQLSKNDFDINTRVTIGAQGWCAPSAPSCSSGTPRINLNSLFPSPGSYIVYAVVDTVTPEQLPEPPLSYDSCVFEPGFEQDRDNNGSLDLPCGLVIEAETPDQQREVDNTTAGVSVQIRAPNSSKLIYLPLTRR